MFLIFMSGALEVVIGIQQIHLRKTKFSGDRRDFRNLKNCFQVMAYSNVSEMAVKSEFHDRYNICDYR